MFQTVYNEKEKNEWMDMHEWFKLRSLGVPALDYAPAPNYYNNLIRLVTNIENALLNYFRHLIFFSY